MRIPSPLDLLDFSWLAKISTSRSTWFKGLLPAPQTVFFLLLSSVAIAGGVALWFGIGAVASAMLAAYFPALNAPILATLGVFAATVMNFWFTRDINTAALSTREVCDAFEYSNNTDIINMVDSLRKELNIHFRAKYGDKHVDLPMPRLLTFTEPHFKMITVEGRNPGKAAIFFSSGVFNYHDSNMTQKELAALIQMELVKIYMRRGVTRTILAMTTEFFSNISNMFSGHAWAKVLGVLAGPLLFFSLIERSVKRSYAYEAGEEVIACGRGLDLIDAIDKKVCATLTSKPTYAEMRANKAKPENSRVPYNGPLQFFLKPLADFVDRNEYAKDDKTGYRFVSFFDILAREFTYHVNELWASEPRSTRTKEHFKFLITAPFEGENGKTTINLDEVTTPQMHLLRDEAKRINKALRNQIPKDQRYRPIYKDGVDNHHNHDHHGHDNAPVFTPQQQQFIQQLVNAALQQQQQPQQPAVNNNLGL